MIHHSFIDQSRNKGNILEMNSASRNDLADCLSQTDCFVINPSAIYNLPLEFEHLRDAFLKEASSKGIEFNLTIANMPDVAYWDITSLRRDVFSNLLSMSLLTTHAGGRISMRISMPDIYSVLVEISATTASSSKATGNAAEAIALVKRCIGAHKGELLIKDNSETHFALKLPLYKLCLQ
jgi:hypothetical protein